MKGVKGATRPPPPPPRPWSNIILFKATSLQQVLCMEEYLVWTFQKVDNTKMQQNSIIQKDCLYCMLLILCACTDIGLMSVKDGRRTRPLNQIS